MPDESAVVVADEDLDRLGRTVQIVDLGLPRAGFPYHYRLICSIALAETCSQVGIRRQARRRLPRPPAHDTTLWGLAEEAVETLWPEDLLYY